MSARAPCALVEDGASIHQLVTDELHRLATWLGDERAKLPTLTQKELAHRCFVFDKIEGACESLRAAVAALRRKPSSVALEHVGVHAVIATVLISELRGSQPEEAIQLINDLVHGQATAMGIH